MTAVIGTLKYAASAGITNTLASLATGSARECTALDNSANNYIDAILTLAVKLQAGTPGSDKSVYVWFYGSEDGTIFGDNATGSDAAVTMRSPTNLRGPFVLATPDAGGLTYKGIVPSVAAYFDGTLPRKWGYVVENKTNISFSATEGDHTKTYTGVSRQAN